MIEGHTQILAQSSCGEDRFLGVEERDARLKGAMGVLLRQNPPGSDQPGGDNNGAPPGSTPTSTATSTPAADASKSAHGPPVVGIIIGVIAGCLGLGLIVFIVLRRTRMKHKNSTYVPKPFKKLWEKWEPRPSHRRLPDTNEHLEPITTNHTDRTGSSLPQSSIASTRGTGETANTASPATTTIAGAGATGGSAVDRHVSIRSIMTLPAYNEAPSHNEQILGREGERGGIDVVVEFPESVDEEEAHREAEMEALYQVRLARRRENEEREERRRLRREARERGDYVALREIQERARAGSATAGPTVEELRVEHDRIKKERQRAVSSVSYGDLGVARHDGTRLRANSVESEREGLLGDAASMAASSQYHRRDRSASSVLSLDTMNSDFPSPRLTRSRADSRPDSPFERITSPQSNDTRPSTHDGQAGSSPEMIEHDDIPPNSPPGYENISLENNDHTRTEPPPDYSSPVVGKGEHRGDPFADSQNRSQSQNRRSAGLRQSMHIGQLMSSQPPRTSPTSPRRGVDGMTPQLPSLRLSNLPSIHVEASTPVVRTPGDDEDEAQLPVQRH